MKNYNNHINKITKPERAAATPKQQQSQQKQ